MTSEFIHNYYIFILQSMTHSSSFTAMKSQPVSKDTNGISNKKSTHEQESNTHNR